MKEDRINCFKCAHYFTTWDEKFPRGCRAMGFKTRQMPSALVYASSGAQCMRFRLKKQKPR